MRALLVIGGAVTLLGLTLYFGTSLDTASYIVTTIGVAVTIYGVVKEKRKNISINQKARAENDITQIAVSGNLSMHGENAKKESRPLKQGDVGIDQDALGKNVKQYAIGGDLNKRDESMRTMGINQTAKSNGPINQLSAGRDIVIIGSGPVSEPEDAIIPENPTLHPFFINREQEISNCIFDLNSRHYTIITGFAGIGKTQLGYAVRDERRKLGKKDFYYTFRKPGSDNMDTIYLFLATFLKKYGENSLMEYLTEEGRSKKGFPNLNKFNLLIKCLERGNYILTFDDCQEIEDDRNITALLGELVTLQRTEVIIISRHSPRFLSQLPDQLEGLDENITLQLFQKHGVVIPSNLLHEFWIKVEGNPYLIELFVDWVSHKLRNISEIRDFIGGMQKREIRGFLLRLCQELSEDQKKIMRGMAIFRGSLIDSAMLQFVTECKDQDEIFDLVDRSFIREGASRGTLRIHQILSDFFVDMANREELKKFHSRAGLYLSTRDFFYSAYHYYEAEEYATAVETLFNNIKPDSVIMNLELLRKLVQRFSKTDLGLENWIRICYINALIESVVGEWQDAENLVNDEILTNSKQIGFHYGEALGLNILGTLYSRRGLKEKAKGYYSKSLELLGEDSQDDLKSRLLNNLGIIARTEKEYDSALDYFEQSIAASKKSGNFTYISETLHNTGIVYSAMKNYEKAKLYYRESVRVSRNINNLRAIAYTYNNLGVLCKLEGRIRAAEKMYLLSLSLKEKIHDIHGKAQTSGNLALLYASNGQLDEAENYSNKAVELFSLIDDYDGIGKIWDNLASFFEIESEKGKIYSEKAKDISNQHLDGISTWVLYRGEFYDALH